MEIDRYPLPRPEELTQKLAGGARFTTLDLSQAYQQMRLDDHSQPYTTVNTRKAFTGMPGYLTVLHVPLQISKTMEQVLHGLEGVCVYIDDLLVTGDTIKAHLNNLENVLTKLQENGLKLQKREVSFLSALC